MQIFKVADPIDLSGLAARVRASSNFRFVWSFLRVIECDLRDAYSLRSVFDRIVDDPELHSFLRHSMDDIYPRTFTIEHLHEHCRIEYSTGDFLEVMARAANDHLGAYSKLLRPATDAERREVQMIFESQGEFWAFALLAGNEQGCAICEAYNHQLFSSWFYILAWDYTYFVTWPEQQLFWMGCLSDTD